ncbi:putative immunity protein [Enterococcus canintestini]|uniref:Imm-5-like domain-containing protein n=1 Tax=Enterococcus canintestini TaxID=317010 RepID=A0A1L8R8S2_9ENTE|nr:hypothetical protein [Enterococcus canintestini]OJG16134.1 hypothetical protein RU96_GL001631 [Enterococcus canintestini]
MSPEEYAWNEHERQLYIANKIIIPSPYKIKIIDNLAKRNELEHILNKLPQRNLAIWARKNAERFISYIDIGDAKQKNEIISKTTAILYKRIDAQINAFELRNAGFLANTLAKESVNEISKFSARVYAQAIATGHMRGHAIVSSDYAIKVINLLRNDVDEAINERNKQILLAQAILLK